MITYLKPLPVGNAVRGLLAVPQGATDVRVLRKTAPNITGADDASAVRVVEDACSAFLDADRLKNGTVYYYQPFYRVGGVWQAGDVESVVPESSLERIGPDPVEVVRKRLEDGLRSEIAAGRLRHENGVVPCLKAPPAYEGTAFPIVTVHLDDDSSAHRGLGEMIAEDRLIDGEWVECEGWLCRHRIKVIGWMPQNADVRMALRASIKALLVGNLPVFAAAGMDQVEFSTSDVEDMESYEVPMFQTVTTLTCVAPFLVAGRTGSIADVGVVVS